MNPFTQKNPFPPAPQPSAWTPVMAIPAQWVNGDIPPGAAVDQTTGEYICGPDGKPITSERLLAVWEEAKVALEVAKERERKYRDQVVACFSNPEKKSGTERVQLLNGYELKMGKSLTYKLVSKDEKVPMLDAVQSVLVRMSQSNVDGAQTLTASLVKWQADLSVTTYKMLPPELKSIIDEVVVTQSGAPQVEIVAPKEAK